MSHPFPKLPGPSQTAGGALVSLRDIQHFLSFYADALEACEDARLAIFTLPNAATFASRDPDALANQAACWAAEKLEAYLHIHLHALADGHAQRRGSTDTVRAAVGLFSDIDARGPGRRKPAETLCPTPAEAISIVEQFNKVYQPLGSSLIISSGHGCYPAILFKEPLLITSADNTTLLESLGRRFHRALHDIAAGHGWTGAVDYCDPAKVLRLPGSINYKDPNSPQPVRLVHESAARFNVSDLDELLPPLEDRHLFPGFEPDAPGTAKVTIALNANPQIEPELVPALRDAHPLFAATWEHRRADLEDQSCSGYDMALAGIGVACGLTDQQIANLLTAHRASFPTPKQERTGASYSKYLRRTISRARAGRESSDNAEREWEAIRAAIDAPTPASMHEPVQPGPRSVSNSAENNSTTSAPGDPTQIIPDTARADSRPADVSAGITPRSTLRTNCRPKPSGTRRARAISLPSSRRMSTARPTFSSPRSVQRAT